MTYLQIGICSPVLCHVICPVPGSVDKVSWTKTEHFPVDIKFSVVWEMCNYKTKTLIVT